ncbi:5' nucleotidase, NT5C type [Oenococcus oeni]|uniref:5' nucleotidase, NT5C type n=1 Tax=Oenococcus oeni TaxID=1247 RepID=UPI0010B1B10C|nr:hypothetical protein [Oenococcus oeni]SYW15394.1 putative 5'(3')-deoxyribonucleotidase [Oenococcus oeni]
MQPKLFFDMDNVLVDTLTVFDRLNPISYQVKKPDQIPGIYRRLPPIIGAIGAVKKLSEHYDTYILSTAPWENSSAWQDKLLWIFDYFGKGFDDIFYKKVILTHDKSFVRCSGGILIDDRPYHGASAWDDSNFGSFWLQYAFDPRLTWEKELIGLMIQASQIFLEAQVNEREALLLANDGFDGKYRLHGSFKDNNLRDWEKNK